METKRKLEILLFTVPSIYSDSYVENRVTDCILPVSQSQTPTYYLLIYLYRKFIVRFLVYRIFLVLRSSTEPKVRDTGTR